MKSEEINIVNIQCADTWHFYGVRFHNDKLKKYFGKRRNCCEIFNVNNAYVYIIEQLKKAGLLDKNYPLLCCECFSRRKEWEIVNACRNH